MDSIEQAFDNSENAAKSALQSATNLVKLSRRLQKAAKEGNIAAIKKSRGGFNDALENLTQVVADAVQSWPYGDEEVEGIPQGWAILTNCVVPPRKWAWKSMNGTNS